MKILGTLACAEWVTSTDVGYRLQEPRALLNSWAAAPASGRATAMKRYVVPGDVIEVGRTFVEAANRLRTRYAPTLFSGARLRAPFVRSFVAHAYLEGDPARIASEIRARPISEGAISSSSGPTTKACSSAYRRATPPEWCRTRGSTSTSGRRPKGHRRNDGDRRHPWLCFCDSLEYSQMHDLLRLPLVALPAGQGVIDELGVVIELRRDAS